MFEFVNTFLAFIKSLHSELRSLNNNLQKHSEAIDKATSATKDYENKAREIRAILNYPESLPASKEAANAREQRYQNRNLLLGLATLIALIIYAITTIFIYCATNKAANAAKSAADTARDMMIYSQRPWVGNDGTPVVRYKSGHWSVAFTVKNFGLSPALYAVPAGGVENLTSSEGINDAIERYCANGEKLTIEAHGYALFPSDPLRQSVSIDLNPTPQDTFMVCTTYMDHFGKQPIHHTRYCYHLDLPLAEGKPLIPCFGGWSAD